jgi:hypothetical protein
LDRRKLLAEDRRDDRGGVWTLSQARDIRFGCVTSSMVAGALAFVRCGRVEIAGVFSMKRWCFNCIM